MEKEQKKGGKLKSFIVGILAVLGVLFLIILFLPDEDDESDFDEESEIVTIEQQAESESFDSEQETDTENDNAAKKADSAGSKEKRPQNDEDISAEEETDKTAYSEQDTDKGGEVKQPKTSNSVHKMGDKTVSVGTDAKSATIMVYMNGSDLESEDGEATTDISEMISSGIGNNVNVIIQTMGTRKWQDYGISSKTAQTYKVENGDLSLIRDNLGQLDCTEKETLSEFISYCKHNYPADRYIFLFWNHGGGPVYGFGYDEWQDEQESLTIGEMAKAFSENNDIHFDIIGMDCCIMASMETCYAFAPYCKYALLSEDFESGLGWSYKSWMSEFEKKPGISTPLLGKYIVDDIIADNEKSFMGSSACMALFNVSTAKNLFSAWKDYAYKNENALLNKNYSRKHKAKARSRGFWDFWASDGSDVTLADYYISDILALTESIDNSSDEAKSLMSALKAAVVYYGHTSDKNELTGLAVSLPYGDSYFYKQLKEVYKDIGLDDEYINWLGAFVSSYGNDNYFDYGDFENSWSGWAAYESDYGCNLSNGGSCEYSYDYDSGDYCDYDDDSCNDDWIYDYEEEIWYLYEDGIIYLYDDETETYFYYDEYTEQIYYWDDDANDWYEVD